MPAGLRCWDEAGNLLVDTTMALGRVVGTVQTGTSSGSLTGISGFLDGIPWYSSIPLDGSLSGAWTPEIAIDGTTLSWSFAANFATNTLIIYGIR